MPTHLREISNFYTSGAWLTIGSFDGVHLGHQRIIRRLTAEAHNHGDPAVVVTFHPHPMAILRERVDAFYLTTPDERAKIMGDLGVDIIFTHEFNKQVSKLSARDFIRILKSHFGIRHLWVGQDFALGHNREGNVEKLKELGQEFDFILNVIEPLNIEGRVISSSMIRSYLREGDVEMAKKLLGRPYQLDGEVVVGDGRGKKIGIPTANLDIENDKLIPENSVYACLAHFDDKELPAATNIGFRPTFDGKKTKTWVETHILDFQGDLYGKYLKIKFISRLRGEMKFGKVQDLVLQIHQDIEETRRIVKEQTLIASQ